MLVVDESEDFFQICGDLFELCEDLVEDCVRLEIIGESKTQGCELR